MAGSDPATLFGALPLDGPVVVFDLEWTAWEGSRERGWSGPREEREIVEIGAVRLDGADALAETIAFDVFVRPTINPILSAYFTGLTHIHQTLIDNDGLAFGEALTLFEAFVGGRDVPILSFSQDPAVLRLNCGLNRLPFPFDEAQFHNVVPALASAAYRRAGTFSTSDLPEIFGFPPTDIAHSAVGDARCIAAALRTLAENRTAKK